MDILFSCNESVYDPQNASMEARFIPIVASSSEHFEGHRPSHHWRKAYLLTQGLTPINPTRMHSKSNLMCGNRGPFLVVAVMVVTVVDFLWHACLFGGAFEVNTESSVCRRPNI